MTDHHHHHFMRAVERYVGPRRTSKVDKNIERRGGGCSAITECRVIKRGFGLSGWLVKIRYDWLTSLGAMFETLGGQNT